MQPTGPLEFRLSTSRVTLNLPWIRSIVISSPLTSSAGVCAWLCAYLCEKESDVNTEYVCMCVCVFHLVCKKVRMVDQAAGARNRFRTEAGDLAGRRRFYFEKKLYRVGKWNLDLVCTFRLLRFRRLVKTRSVETPRSKWGTIFRRPIGCRANFAGGFATLFEMSRMQPARWYPPERNCDS